MSRRIANRTNRVEMKPNPENIALLETLHRIHRQLADLHGRRDRAPRRITVAEGRIRRQEQHLEDLREKEKEMRQAADKKHLDLKSGETKISELETKLNETRDNTVFQSLKDQIAAQRMTNSILDDEILEAWEEIEAFHEQIVQAEKEVEEAKQDAESVRKDVAEELPIIDGDLARLNDELKEAESELPHDIREIYLRVVREKKDDALAEVRGEVCSGCHYKIQINVVANLRLGMLAACPVCGRLLYYTES